MTEFETIFITKPDLDEASKKALVEKLQGICGAAGSHLLSYKDWGVRKLAYEIKKQRRGNYFFVNFLGATNVVPELERNLRYDEKVIRFMTVRVSEIEDVPMRLEAAKTQDVLAPADAPELGGRSSFGGRGRGPRHGDGEDSYGADETPTGSFDTH